MFNLQMFTAQPVKGKRIIYLFRIYDERSTETGSTIAFTTENSRSVSKDADTTATKDGNIRTPNDAEIEISVTSLLSNDDDDDLIYDLEDAMLHDKKMEIWEANLDDPQDGTYALTSDTEIDSSKTYYTRSGTSPNYTYTAVENPVKSSLSSYYEMTATKFKGKYYQGYLTSFEKTSNAEDFVECSLDFGIDGIGADGNVTVTAEQQEAAAYAFADTTAVGA